MTKQRMLVWLLLAATPLIIAAQPWQVTRHTRQVDEDLLKAILERDVGLTKALLAKGADPNFVKETANAQRVPVLYAAVRRTRERDDRGRSREIAKALVAAGASTTLTESSGSLTICSVVSEDDVDALEVLLDVGADVNARGPDGETLLMQAAGQGSEAVVTELLARGADACLKDKRGATAADYARSFADDELEPGARPDERIVRLLEDACRQRQPN